MNKVAALAAGERRDLFQETGARRGMSPAIAEKDFWVCWVLKRLFEDPELRGRLLGYGAALDEEPATSTQRDKFNKGMNAKAAAYIGGPLLAHLAVTLAGAGVAVDAEDAHTVNIAYPAVFREAYLRPEVRLEIGPLASWVPSAEREIRPYSADSFPAVFVEPVCTVVAIDAERTFWEKATILHQQAHRTDMLPARYSRHYYDLYKLAASDMGRYAAGDMRMLADVVAFKRRFYPSKWARYETAAAGTLRLSPREDQLTALRRDYAAMGVMIFGGDVEFGAILRGLEELERRINGWQAARQ